MCACVFAANIKFINWMLCIRNCEAFEHYNGDLTQLFIIVAFQWLALFRSGSSIQRKPTEKAMLARTNWCCCYCCCYCVSRTDFEIESYKYIVCCCCCSIDSKWICLLQSEEERERDGGTNGISGYFKCNCSRRNSKTNLIHFTVYFLDAFIYLWT